MILSFILLVLCGPRFLNFIWWLLRPGVYNLAFQSNIFIGILGVIFLPWTTLMYVLSFSGGITGLEWIFIAIGFVSDIASYGGSGYGAKKQMTPASTTPQA